MAVATTPAEGQWVNFPQARTPLTRDGKPNLLAKAPRAPDGKPDLSGVWQIEAPPVGEFERLFGKLDDVELVIGDHPRLFSKHFFNILVDFKPGEAPLRPEAAAVALKNGNSREDRPSVHCLPLSLLGRELIAFPFKIFQTRDELALFSEADGTFRQIHTDGRRLPVDPQPSWMGYSTGKWEGDTLVVETAGFNDRAWLDGFGHPQSEQLHVQERFHRRDFGHLHVDATVEDPKVLTRSVTSGLRNC